MKEQVTDVWRLCGNIQPDPAAQAGSDFNKHVLTFYPSF